MDALPRLVKGNPKLLSGARGISGNLAIHFAALGGHVAALDYLSKASAHTTHLHNLKRFAKLKNL
jgi:hypothetical protein